MIDSSDARLPPHVHEATLEGMFFIGFGTAVPSQRYAQTEGWETLRQSPIYATLQSRSQAIARKVLLGANGVEYRHLALDRLADAFDSSVDTLHARFEREAPKLATQAARKALTAAEVGVEGIDALLIATCTGYLCPGLTSYVSEQLGLRPNVRTLDLVGLGCGAALPTLNTAELFLRTGARKVLVVCVEVCSAAFYLDDDPGVLISACLFGDGAAAVVLSLEPKPEQRAVRWHTMDSRLDPAHRDLLRFETRGGKLRNILTLRVPELAAGYAAEILESVTTSAGVPRSAVREWILHAGGRDVLTALQRRFGLSERDLRHSAGVLRNYGNLSSPSVLFALQSALENDAAPGWWWMTSFGAGFSCHGALLEVGPKVLSADGVVSE